MSTEPLLTFSQQSAGAFSQDNETQKWNYSPLEENLTEESGMEPGIS